VELTVAVHAEREGFWAEVHQLPGCFAAARTLSELTEAVQEAVEMCVEDDPLLPDPPLRVEPPLQVLGPNLVCVRPAG
jgi:predicted RNase H-like HicB family nuclease